jgi:hypothetical protein
VTDKNIVVKEDREAYHLKFTLLYNRKKQHNYRLGNAAMVGELILQAGLASICN